MSDTCVWTLDEDDVSTCSNCDMQLVWEDYGNPQENGYKFCPGCGAKIETFVVKKPSWEEE